MGAVRHLPPVAAGMWRCRDPLDADVVSRFREDYTVKRHLLL